MSENNCTIRPFFRKLRTVSLVVLVTTIFFLFVISLNYSTERSFPTDVYYIDQVNVSIDGSEPEPMTLPHRFTDLDPDTSIVMTATITPQPEDTIFIKSMYAPAKIYLDDVLLHEFGLQKSYPKYMLDPALEVHIIELNGQGKPAELRMEFRSPSSIDTLLIEKPMAGVPKNVIWNLFLQVGIPLIFALMQILLGISLCFIAFCVIFLDRKGILFLWLGLTSLSTGCWSLAKNNFTGNVIKNPAFLYIVSFVGLYTFIIPLLKFVKTIVNFEDTKPVCFMELFFTFNAAVVVFLQLIGVHSLVSCMVLYHATIPPALCILTLLTYQESRNYDKINAKRLVLPLGALALTAIMEMLNYLFLFTYNFTPVFQAGMLLFLLVMGIIGGLYLKDTIDIQNRQKQLSIEKHMLDLQIKEQKENGLLLARNEQMLSQQRHDLRHHLAVISELAQDNEKLQIYLGNLTEQIPKAKQRFSENNVINALISHYHSICEQNHIELVTHLVVPEKGNTALDSDLCVIFANLLENAVEACCRMEEGERFIRLNSTMQYDMLIITMDNSFNGIVHTRNSRYLSSKRNDYGIGLASIQSVARKYNGDGEFTCNDKVFQSSVYLNL